MVKLKNELDKKENKQLQKIRCKKVLRSVLLPPFRAIDSATKKYKNWKVTKDSKNMEKTVNRAIEEIAKIVIDEFSTRNKLGDYIFNTVNIYKYNYWEYYTINLNDIFVNSPFKKRYKNCYRYLLTQRQLGLDVDIDCIYHLLYNYFLRYSDLQVNNRVEVAYTDYHNTPQTIDFIEIIREV